MWLSGLEKKTKLVARRTICFDATSVRIPACANKKGKIRKEWKKNTLY
jgi:hypothetical protein